MSQVLTAATQLAQACADVLQAAGVPVPDTIAVDAKEGDWVPRAGEGCPGCHQIVVTPGAARPTENNPVDGGVDRGARRLTWSFQVQIGWCVDEADVDQRYGNIALPPDAPANEGTAFAETAHIVAVREALARDVPRQWTWRLCQAIGPRRDGYLVDATPWVEGGCAGTVLTVEVPL